MSDFNSNDFNTSGEITPENETVNQEASEEIKNNNEASSYSAHMTDTSSTPDSDASPINGDASSEETSSHLDSSYMNESSASQEAAASQDSGYFNHLHRQPEEDSTYHYTYRKATPTEEPPKKIKKKGRGRRFTKFVAAALAFGLIAGAAFQGFNTVYYKINPSAKPTGSTVQTTTTLTTSKDTISTTTDLSEMVENVMPSIVSITSIVEQQVSYGWWGQSGTQESEGAGSGIIIGQNDNELLVVTNYHVIEDAKSLSVGFIDDSSVEATVKGYDSDADLAVVSVAMDKISDTTKSSIKVATLGESSALKVGEPAIAIGNALGYGQSVTAGYVSAKDREVALTDKTMTLLQTDAAINPGNSGGALLNIKGEVIGINTVKYSDTTVEGMGYAIPIDTAKPIIEALMNKETIPESQQAYLGISGSDITESYSQQLGLPEGIYVQEVQQGSPAENGGIYAGDVIVKYEGNSVTSMESLINKMGNNKAGDEVTITVSRRTQLGEFEEKDLTITLGAKSEQK